VRLYRNIDNPAEMLLLADLQGIWAVQSPEFRQAWTCLVARLNAQSATYARGVQVLIL
jgi:hypothetical protein